MDEDGRWKRATLISTTLSFFILSYALLVLSKYPVEGYELSIYSSTPLIFWIAVIICIFNGIFLITLGVFGKTEKMWVIGMFEILFCNSLVISLYALRGYVLYSGRGDVASYVGMAADVYKYGCFLDYNFYPITSILIAQLSQMTNISILSISKYLTPLFFVLYTLSIYCWSKSLIPDKKFVFTSIIASTPIFFAWFSTSIYHMLLSVLTIPFFFYCLQRNSDYRFRFFCIIMCIIYPFFHPITAVIILLYLVLTFMSEQCYPTCKKYEKKISTTLILIFFISFVTWFISQYILLDSAKSIILQVLGSLEAPTTEAHAQYYLQKLGTATALKSFLLMTADEIIFNIIALVAIFYLLMKSKKLFERKFISIALCFIGGSLFILMIFFFSSAHTPDRLINLNINMVLTLPLVGYLLYRFSLNEKKVITIFLISLILVSVVTSLFSLYPSTLTVFPNDQTTVSEVIGMNWLISQKNPDFRTADVMTPVFRYSDLIHGYDFSRAKGEGKWRRDLSFPDHFGFSEHEIFPIDETRYLVITEYDIQAYTEVWKDIHRFTKEDFTKIDRCKNTDKIYENGEFQSYLVYPGKIPPPARVPLDEEKEAIQTEENMIVLFHQNYLEVDTIPNNIFTALLTREKISTVSLDYDAIVNAIDITTEKGENGEVYIAGLYPQPNSTYHIKCAYNTDHPDSVANIRVGNVWLGIQRRSNEDLVMVGYFYGINGLEYKTLTIDSGIGDIFEIEIITDDKNKSAVIKCDQTASMELPFWDKDARNLTYPVPPSNFIRIYHWVPPDATYSSLAIYEVTQQTNRWFITPIAPPNLQPFGLDGPHPLYTVRSGIEYLNNCSFSGTLWLDVDGEWRTNETVRTLLRDLVKNEDWDVGIHFSQRLNDIPLYKATALMQAEYDYVEEKFGYAPSSWCSLQNADNITHAIWAYENLGMIWRNGNSGVDALPNVGNLDNATWSWWNDSLKSGIIHPTFTHRTDIELAIPYSIDFSKFIEWVNSYKSINYEVVGFYQWWEINNNAYTAHFDNIYTDDDSCRFTAYTNGEKTYVNVDLPAQTHTKVVDQSVGEIKWTENTDGSISFYVQDGHTYTITSS